jgi:hypothetical protein
MSNLAIVHNTASSHPHRPPADLRTTVEELRRRHRRADTDELAERLTTLLSEDAALLLECSRFAIQRIGAAIDARVRRQQAAPSNRERTARRAADRAQVQEIVEQVKLAVLDMVITTLDGEPKRLRFATGKELAALGSGYQRLAERIGPDEMLGERMTESEVQALLE